MIFSWRFDYGSTLWWREMNNKISTRLHWLLSENKDLFSWELCDKWFWQTKLMSFLRKVFGFGGCSRLYNNTVDTSIVTIEEDDELIETENILTDVHFIPWSSPGEIMKYFSTKHTNNFCRYWSKTGGQGSWQSKTSQESHDEDDESKSWSETKSETKGRGRSNICSECECCAQLWSTTVNSRQQQDGCMVSSATYLSPGKYFLVREAFI